MIISHYLFSKPISFEDDNMYMLVFENPADMGMMVSELSRQLEGLPGSFVLSNDSRELDMHKYVDFVVDPFSLDCNSKDILAGFYKEVSQNLEVGTHYETVHSIIGELMGMVMDVASSAEPDSDYSELSIQAVLKGMSLGFLKSDSLLENLCDYVRLVSRYTSKKLMVLVNMSRYFSESDYLEMIRYFRYLQFPVLMVESGVRDVGIPVRLFDLDFCELDLKG